ncbi:hypothetical protein HYT45_01035 [Candidatus Uhrbacteria bacterium]|nr:hypothetical protein [Candidatus Uhrbacteria bacterium]
MRAKPERARVSEASMPKRISGKKRTADEEAPRISQPEHLSLRAYKKTAVAFLALVFVLLAAIAYVSFAKATVIIKARTTDAEAEFRADARSDPNQSEVRGEVREIALEGESAAQISADVKELPSAATGTVRILNEMKRSQTLVVKTRLLSPDGVLFRLKKTVSVPAGGEIKTEVYADKEGASGDIGPTRFVIPGLNAENQKKVYAVSDAPMTGGLTLKIGVGQADIDRALEEIGNRLLEEGKQKLGAQWSPGAGNAEIYQKKIISWKADQKIGGQAENVKVKAKVAITGVRYDREKLLELAEAKLRERAKDEEELRDIDREGFEVNIISADSIVNAAVLSARLKGKLAISSKSKVLDPDQLIGLTKSSAEEYLRGFNAVEDAQIKVRPFWLRRLPNLRERIKIKVITE